MPIRMVEPTARSTTATITVENGKISRGKYTLATRLMLAVKDPTENLSDEANRFHASSPAYEKTGYGTPTSSGATFMNTTEKMTVLTSGVKMAQPNPMIVCLYRSSRSRRVI